MRPAVYTKNPIGPATPATGNRTGAEPRTRLSAERARPADLVVCGASARALAFSALHAGLHPAAVDLFGDLDLRRVVPARLLPPAAWPGGLSDALAELAGRPLVWTGGLEGAPEILEDLARRFRVAGSPPAAVRAARDPLRLSRVLRAAGLESPEVLAGHTPPREPGWLVKSLRGSGGAGVRPAGAPPRATAGAYFQRRVRGVPVSSLHAAGPRGVRLLAVTRQLVGERELAARPFAWCGNVGPLALPWHIELPFRRAGEAAAEAFGLRGLFGLDALLDGDTPRFVELNPRYTACVEVVEDATGAALLPFHAGIAEGELPRPTHVTGKAVLRAPRELCVPEAIVRAGRSGPGPGRELADLPDPGTRIARGRPVITVFARASHSDACLRLLRHRARESLRTLLASPQPAPPPPPPGG